MGLACGIVGLPNVGKTTIFNAITLSDEGERSSYAYSTTEPIPGTVDIPDDRLNHICKKIETKRVIPGQMTVVDIPGLEAGSRESGRGVGFLGAIKESDVLLHVVRCFENPGVMHVSGDVDPEIDAEIVEMELAQVDLDTLKRNIDRVGRKARSGDADCKAQAAIFQKAIDALEADKLLRQVEFTPAEMKVLYPLFLLTGKPVLFVANVGDDDIDGTGKHVESLKKYAERTGAHVVHICGDTEAELARMEEEERNAFMEDLGLTESGLGRLITRGFELLGLQTYFTAGELEVRAWTIHKGDTAPVGAAVIHTDFEKKFIRAEVYTYDHLMEFGSEAAIKAAGKMRVEGKTYVLQDGDVCHFLIGN